MTITQRDNQAEVQPFNILAVMHTLKYVAGAATSVWAQHAGCLQIVFFRSSLSRPVIDWWQENFQYLVYAVVSIWLSPWHGIQSWFHLKIEIPGLQSSQSWESWLPVITFRMLLDVNGELCEANCSAILNFFSKALIQYVGITLDGAVAQETWLSLQLA